MSDNGKMLRDGEIFDRRYKLVNLLSEEGGSGDVWLALDLNTMSDSEDEEKATRVVIKIYRPKNFLDIEGEYQFRNEFKKVFGCHHENIIQPTYFSIYDEKPYLVLPYCPAGSSELLIGSLTTKEDIWKYIFEVSSGLAYLHEHTPQIIHQDIKPANVLIDDNGNYAITDFGISARLGGADASAQEETGGTFAYMAPERFRDDIVPMAESDIWALGATIYEIITGDAPFGNDGGSRQEKDTVIPPIKENVPDAVKELVYSCLAYDPAARPTARDIVDTVLKKRYSKNKKITWILSLIGVAVIGGIICFGILYNPGDATQHFDVLSQRADSILNSQIEFIGTNFEGIDQSNIQALENSKQILVNVLSDAPPEYIENAGIQKKEETVNKLIEEMQLYMRNRDLSDKALRTELMEEYEAFSLEAELHRMNINNLINQIK